MLIAPIDPNKTPEKGLTLSQPPKKSPLTASTDIALVIGLLTALPALCVASLSTHSFPLGLQWAGSIGSLIFTISWLCAYACTSFDRSVDRERNQLYKIFGLDED
jgi:hypothetical protein